jgi:hypothetical protein
LEVKDTVTVNFGAKLESSFYGKKKLLIFDKKMRRKIFINRKNNSTPERNNFT